MSVEKIVNELEKDHDNISYVYIRNGKEYFTPNLRVAIQLDELGVIKVPLIIKNQDLKHLESY